MSACPTLLSKETVGAGAQSQLFCRIVYFTCGFSHSHRRLTPGLLPRRGMFAVSYVQAIIRQFYMVSVACIVTSMLRVVSVPSIGRTQRVVEVLGKVETVQVAQIRPWIVYTKR